MDIAKFAPFNDDFAQNPDQNYVAGPYSTFDVDLSSLEKQIQSRLKFCPKSNLLIALGVAPVKRISLQKIVLTHAAQRLSYQKLYQFNTLITRVFIDTITYSPIHQQLKHFNTALPKQRLRLAKSIVESMIQNLDRHGMRLPKIPISASDNTDFMCFISNSANPYEDAIWININPHTNYTVSELCVGLVHELVHAIDYYTPNHSPLGAQLSYIATEYAIPSNFRSYHNSPSEINAYFTYDLIQDIVKDLISLPETAQIPYPTHPHFSMFSNVKIRD